MLAMVMFLGACTQYVTRPDGTKMPADVYAHIASVEAYSAQSKSTASCDRAASMATSDLGKVASLLTCANRAMVSGASNQAPVYTPAPTAAQTGIEFLRAATPLGLGIAQLVGADRANERMTVGNIAIAGINARRELGIVQAATGSNERIAVLGFSAVRGVSESGFSALSDSSAASAFASAQSFSSVVNMVANLPPTTQIIAGRDVIQARDVDQSQTTGVRVQGNGNETLRRVDCVSVGGAGGLAQGTAQGTATGTTNPLGTTYNALTAGAGALASNNCGGG